MGKGNAGELLRRVREDTDADAAGVQASERRTHVRVAPEVDRRAVLRVALEEPAPVRQLGVEIVRIDAVAAASVVEPVLPQRVSGPESGEADRQGLHRSRTRSQTS